MLALVKQGIPEIIEWRWGSVIETAWSIMAVQCAMLYWSWEKIHFKVDDDDADIPALNGADAAADQNKSNKKHKFIDGPMINDGVNSKCWWIYSRMIMFAEDAMVAVRAFGLSCPCRK